MVNYMVECIRIRTYPTSDLFTFASHGVNLENIFFTLFKDVVTLRMANYPAGKIKISNV